LKQLHLGQYSKQMGQFAYLPIRNQYNKCVAKVWADSNIDNLAPVFLKTGLTRFKLLALQPLPYPTYLLQ